MPALLIAYTIWLLVWLLLEKTLTGWTGTAAPVITTLPTQLTWGQGLLIGVVSPVVEEWLFRGRLWGGIAWCVKRFLTGHCGVGLLVCGVVTGVVFIAFHHDYQQHPLPLAYITWSTLILTLCRLYWGNWHLGGLCHMAINMTWVFTFMRS
jgi:membrane protease YdiL (CAAX protease family)